MKKKVNVTTRKSAWQLQVSAARKNLAWAWERMTWMALGAVLMAFAMMVWR